MPHITVQYLPSYLHTLEHSGTMLQYPLWTIQEIQLHRDMTRSVVAGMVGVILNKTKHIGYHNRKNPKE